MEVVLRQGLVHPVTCVPYLIASEVDEQEMNSKISHSLLMQMNEKYVSSCVGNILVCMLLFYQRDTLYCSVKETHLCLFFIYTDILQVSFIF
jgi:hypothetical protein